MADMSQITISMLGVDGVSGPARAAAGGLGALEGAAGKIGGAMVGVAEAALKAAAAVTALGAAAAVGFTASSVKVAADFQQQISAIAAVSGAAGDQLKSISDAALQLGKDTSFSATQAAAGMEEIIKAGVSLQNTLNGGAKAALDLAAASSTAVPEAAAIMSNAMNIFAISGDKAGHVADVLTQASNASATSVHDLGYSLAAGGAAAQIAGVSFEDTALAFALLAQHGIKGADAGTSFKSMLLQLTPSTKAAKTEMQQLGIITADGANQLFTAEGKAKSMADMAGVLNKALSGLTDAQRVEALQTMFGTDGFRLAAILMEENTDGANKMAAAMTASGTAQAAAAVRLDNLKGALEKLGGSWEVVKIQFGTAFLPILTKGALALTEALNKAEPAITAFAERAAAGLDVLITRATAAGPRFLAFGAGLLAFGRQGLALAQNVIPKVIEQFKALTSGLSFGGVASGAGSFINGLVGAFKQVEPVVMSVGRAVVANITETFNFLATRVLPPVVSIIQQIGGVLERTLLPAAAQTGAVMRGIFGDTLDWLAKTVMPPFLSIVTQTSNFFTQVMLPTLPAVATALRTTLGETVQWLAKDVWPGLVAAATMAWGYISGTIIPALPAAAALIRGALGAALEWVATTGWPMLVKGATVAWTFITTQLIPTVTDLIGWLKEKLPPAIAAVTAAWEAVRSRVQPIVEALFNGDIKTAISKAGAAFSEFGTLALGWIKEQVAKVDWTAVWAASKDVAIALGTYVAGLAVDFAKWLGAQAALIPWAAVWAQVKDVAVTLGTYLAGLAVDFAKWLGAQVALIPWPAVWVQAKEVATTLATYLGTLAVDFKTWLGAQVALIDWPAVWANVKVTSKIVMDAIATAVGALDAELTTWLNKMILAVKWDEIGTSVGKSLGQALLTNTQSSIDAVGPQLKPETIRQALADFFVGVITGAWGEAMKRWLPTRPNWWPTQVPWPFGPQAGSGMEFPVTTGGLPGQTQGPAGPGGASRGSSAPSQMRDDGADLGPIDNSSRESFVRTAYPWALRAANGNVQEANQQLAIAISENGDIGKPGVNFADTGFNFSGVHAQPGEPSFRGLDAGRPTDFRAYANPAEGLGSYMQFLQANPRYAPALAAYQQHGDIDRLTRDANAAGYSETPGWENNIRNIRQSQIEPVTANLPAPQIRTNFSNTVGNPMLEAPGPGGASALSDFQATQREWSQNASDAGAICGPRLAALFADAVGRPPTPAEARSLAESMGIYSGAGSGSGILSASGFDSYATRLIQQSNPGSTASVRQQMGVSNAQATDIAAQSLAGGAPLAGFNTQGHYFGADQFDPSTGAFHVGGTGLSLAGGSEWMTVDEMTAKMGPLLGVLELVGAKAEITAAALPPVAQSAQDVGEKTAEAAPGIVATTDALATVPPAVEAVGSSFLGLPGIIQPAVDEASAGVLTAFDMMGQGALTSVTSLGDGVLTTTQTMAGGTIATVTDMAGQVTNQSATLANGVSLNMSDMGIQTTTSVNEMAGTITTLVTDLAGNAISTTTNMQGQVVSQFTTMSTTGSSAVTTLGNTSVTQFGNTGKAATGIIAPVKAAGQALVDIPQADMSDTVKEFGRATEAAKAYTKALVAAAKASEDLPGKGGGSKSGSGKSSGLEKGAGASGDFKAAGGPVFAGQGYLIGENGPEFFVPGANGTIIPNHALSSGGTRGSLYGGSGSDLDYDKLAAALARQPIVVEMNGQIVAEIVRGELIATARLNGGSSVLFE